MSSHVQRIHISGTGGVARRVGPFQILPARPAESLLGQACQKILQLAWNVTPAAGIERARL